MTQAWPVQGRHWAALLLWGKAEQSQGRLPACPHNLGGWWRGGGGVLINMCRACCVGERRQEGAELAGWFLCWKCGASVACACRSSFFPCLSGTKKALVVVPPQASSAWGPTHRYALGAGILVAVCSEVCKVSNWFCCSRRLGKKIKNRHDRVLIQCKAGIFYPCLKFLFPFQRWWWVGIKRLLSYGIPVVLDGVGHSKNKCVFKKGNCFAMELGYSVEDLMDCVCAHDFMRDRCIFFQLHHL